MTIDTFIKNINNNMEESDYNLDDYVWSKLEEYIFLYNPEHKPDILSTRIDGVNIVGYSIYANDVTIAISCGDFSFAKEAIDLEEFQEKISKVANFRHKYNNLNQLDNVFSVEDPRYSLFEFLITNPNCNIEIVYSTFNIAHSDVKDYVDMKVSNKNTKVSIVDYYKIEELLEIAEESTRGIIINFEEFQNKYSIVSNSADNVVATYLFFINAYDLVTIFEKYKTTLLQENVRLYLANTNVNKGIIETLQMEPEMFASYNNGISATAKNIKIENGYLKNVKDLQIVNGGQTTATLYEAYKKGIDLHTVFVQVKISIITQNEFYNDIILDIAKFANSQNAIKKSDFATADVYFVSLESLSKNVHINSEGQYMHFERMRAQYKLVESSLGKEQAKFKYPFKTDIKEVAQLLNIYKFLPYISARGGEKNLEHFITNHLQEKEMSLEEYKELVSIKKIMLLIDECLEYSTAPGVKYQTSSRSKNYGSISSSVKYYSSAVILRVLKENGMYDFIEDYNKDVKDYIDIKFIIDIIDATYFYFEENLSNINMDVRKEQVFVSYKLYIEEKFGFPLPIEKIESATARTKKVTKTIKHDAEFLTSRPCPICSGVVVQSLYRGNPTDGVECSSCAWKRRINSYGKCPKCTDNYLIKKKIGRNYITLCESAPICDYRE